MGVPRARADSWRADPRELTRDKDSGIGELSSSRLLGNEAGDASAAWRATKTSQKQMTAPESSRNNCQYHIVFRAVQVDPYQRSTFQN